MSAIVHLMSPFTPEGETRDRVYRFVRELLEAGEPPTLREVQAACGFRAVETARKHLERLVEEGLLEKSPGKARGYRLPSDHVASDPRSIPIRSIPIRSIPIRSIPILGRVPAGEPFEAIEYSEGFVPVESDSERLFALRVEGESMTGAGILPGDIVIVLGQDSPQGIRSGEIVVARIDGEATVKTLRRRGRRLELHPENPDYEVIPVKASSEFAILGKVIEVRRKLGSDT